MKILRNVFNLLVYFLALYGLISLFSDYISYYDAVRFCENNEVVCGKEYKKCRFDCQYAEKNVQQVSQTYENLCADSIIVEKKRRKMYLMKENQVLKEYKISLGSNPIGAKHQESDGKTPEGKYVISGRNPKSRFHLSLKISYPNDEDVRWAKEHGVPTGGDIMIHGFPNRVPDFLFNYFHKSDWTQGCIAVTNEQIEEIWKLVKDGTPIEIRP